MGTGIVITVAEKVFAVLHSQELRGVCSMFGYEAELDDLKTTVFTIKSVLLDAESKHQELTHGGRDYIEKLKEIVYDVDDVLDEFNTMVQRAKIKKGSKISKKVRRFFSRSNQIVVAYNMSHTIKNLRGKLDKIAKDRQQFGLSDVYVPLKRREETMSFVPENYVIGRETDRDIIVGMLLGDSESSNDVDYVTIVGIGGLGKTTLAQLVYDDPRIEDAFELRMWVCVSDDFVLEKIFQKMLGRDGSAIGELQREVRNLLQGKRYLLVLDDVWSESRNEWDSLKSLLDLGGTDSRVLVTSRSKKVARVVGDDLMYELKGLSDDSSWALFKRLAFKQGEEPMNNNDRFFDIGKEIVEKCANVPLSIRVVGSMLYDQHESKWLSIKSDNLMETREGEDGVMPILKYSYYHLTPALKSCFSYCALFPKDFMISKVLLIRLWLAQGCLENPHDCQGEVDIGEEYFSILLHRCFFQDTKKDNCGEIEYCQMHDLIHDLALEVAGKETVIFDSLKSQLGKKISHVSFTENGYDLLANSIAQLSELKTSRTFLLVFPWKYTTRVKLNNVTEIFSHLRRLRVLDLHQCSVQTLPNTLGNLLHLRYLDLSGNLTLMILPNSITELINLQVLNLDETSVTVLPRDMKKLVNLRHLSLRKCSNLSHMPPGLDTLTSLHNLTMFVVGDETSSQGSIGKLRDLIALVNLRDELTIKFDDSFRYDVAEYEEVELLRLMPLKHLTIQFSDQGEANHETLLGYFHPQCRLSTISIEGYKGLKLPLWAESLTSSLPHLVSIRLENFDCLEILPSLGQLHHLKYLELMGIFELEFVESDEVVIPLNNQLIFFPSLEELKLIVLPKLKGWWREESSRVTGEGCASSMVLPSFPRLQKLVLERCPNLIAFPSCPKLTSVELSKCHEALTLLGSRTTTFCNPTTSFVLNLERLTIDNSFGALDCLFRESLGGIKELTINYFEGENFLNLTAEAVVRLNIQELYIWDCNNLKSLSGFVEHLTCLQTLSIGNCENMELENTEEGLTMTPWNSLHSLSSLTLFGLPKLINLPEAFQDYTSLEYLSVGDCENLEALPEWLNCLTSLRTLWIEGCHKLKSLPEAIAHMPSLETLDLSRNEVLKKRFEEPNGEDWPKICCIPYVSIDWY